MVCKLKIESDAALLCLTHAFSTENEEVMGLLIGEITKDNVAHVYSVIMLRRSDKRKDRVEISPEQLSNASFQAESLGMETKVKRPMRVVGWYHSHPHITVWPSHVDVRTQAMYQMMDEDFVGVIVSCFSEDTSSLSSDIQIICFQAIDLGTPEFPRLERLEIEVEIIPSNSLSNATLSSLFELPGILEEEESEAYRATLIHKMQDLVTALHNGAVYTKSLCQLIDVVCAPLLETLEKLLRVKNIELENLMKVKEELQKNVLSTL